MIPAKQSRPIISNQIDQLRKRLDAWRKSHRPRSRLSNRLWDSAVRVAGQCGLNTTSKALHLDYYDLKKRLEAATVRHRAAPSFIELVPSASSPFPECLIEIEGRSGAKMRIHLKGVALPDLTTLGNMFWRKAK